jgi:hypothetical protein
VPRTCTICSHPARERIDSELVRRTPYRNIAQRFSVSGTALSRHLNEHLAEYVQKALSEYATEKGVKVLERLSGVLGRLEGFLDEAEEQRDARSFVVVAAELRKELELLAKLQGDLDQEGAVNLTVHPEWIEIRNVLVATLGRFPDAREAVMGALEGQGTVDGA